MNRDRSRALPSSPPRTRRNERPARVGKTEFTLQCAAEKSTRMPSSATSCSTWSATPARPRRAAQRTRARPPRFAKTSRVEVRERLIAHQERVANAPRQLRDFLRWALDARTPTHARSTNSSDSTQTEVVGTDAPRTPIGAASNSKAPMSAALPMTRAKPGPR